MENQITWLGHDSFKIKGENAIYIDPWKLSDGEPADIILITHDHYDHFSQEDIEKIRADDTVVVTNKTVAKSLKGPVRIVGPGDKLSIKGVEIEAVPAYNINKQFHPKTAGGLGFVIVMSGERIYHAGDTDLIPEMEDIQCDIALLPVSGTYVMTAEEAADAAKKINPRLCIPMHYGEIVGTVKDAHQFKVLCPCETLILEKQ
jgi:L-ascorbate metabolism protein UlaG (beta-lactamase superfamily)